MFIEAEAHPYLQGKIGFLLDFSTLPEGSLDSDAFTRYSDRARAVLDAQIRGSAEHLLERALLSMDDYLIGRGSAKFSFCKPDAGTYRDRSENWFKVVDRPRFRDLLDCIDGDAATALRELIKAAVCPDWRKFVVAEPQLIDYCAESLIHREGAGDIYLLSRKRLSGYHAELRSYALFLALQRSKNALSGMIYRYDDTYDNTQPALVVHVGVQELRISYQAHAWTSSGSDGQMPIPEMLANFMVEHGFTESSN